MNRHTPLVVLSSLLGSLCIYCASSVANGGAGRAVGTANADGSQPSACCTAAPGFVPLAEGDLSVTAVEGEYTHAYSADIDVSGYREVSVLADSTNQACISGTSTRFRASADSAHWGDGMPAAGVPIRVIAPIMQVDVRAQANNASSCATSFHYTVLGLK